MKKSSIWILVFGISLVFARDVYFGLSYAIAIILALEILMFSKKMKNIVQLTMAINNAVIFLDIFLVLVIIYVLMKILLINQQ